MMVLISGGSKSGKSSYAQAAAVYLANRGPLYYLATMIPSDREDQNRIRLHIEDRAGMGFTTVECGCDFQNELRGINPNAAVLLDSTTALLMNEMFSAKGIDDRAGIRCTEEILWLAERVRHLIVVSDRIYEDAQRYDEITEQYRKALASIDRTLARKADTVIEVTAGIPYFHKGGLLQ